MPLISIYNTMASLMLTDIWASYIILKRSKHEMLKNNIYLTFSQTVPFVFSLIIELSSNQSVTPVKSHR